MWCRDIDYYESFCSDEEEEREDCWPYGSTDDEDYMESSHKMHKGYADIFKEEINDD